MNIGSDSHQLTYTPLPPHYKKSGGVGSRVERRVQGGVRGYGTWREG